MRNVYVLKEYSGGAEICRFNYKNITCSICIIRN